VGIPRRHYRRARFIAVVNRLFDLGAALGNILFVALPLVAAKAAASRLHHQE